MLVQKMIEKLKPIEKGFYTFTYDSGLEVDVDCRGKFGAAGLENIAYDLETFAPKFLGIKIVKITRK